MKQKHNINIGFKHLRKFNPAKILMVNGRLSIQRKGSNGVASPNRNEQI